MQVVLEVLCTCDAPSFPHQAERRMNVLGRFSAKALSRVNGGLHRLVDDERVKLRLEQVVAVTPTWPNLPSGVGWFGGVTQATLENRYWLRHANRGRHTSIRLPPRARSGRRDAVGGVLVSVAGRVRGICPVVVRA